MNRQQEGHELVVGGSRTGSRRLTNWHLEPHEPAVGGSRTGSSSLYPLGADLVSGAYGFDSSDKSMRFIRQIDAIHGAKLPLYAKRVRIV